jgi:predicted amidohydrolase YtcJ
MVADEIYLNGNVVTMAPVPPTATSFAVAAGRFAAVGSEDEVRALAGKRTRIIDLKGRTVVPGFIETHCHLSLYAMVRLQANCATPPNRSIEEVKHRIGEMVRLAGARRWIRGWGYDDSLIAERRHLSRQDLDDAAPGTPVFISHASGHLAYANSPALEIAGIGRNCRQPAGGEVDLDPAGRPTGLLKEEGAQSMVTRHIPPYGIGELKAAMQEAVQDYYRAGITSAHDAAIGYFRDAEQILPVYEQLAAEKRLQLRTYLTVVEADYHRLPKSGAWAGIEPCNLKPGAVKFFQDGSIQALTAALVQPYHCRPDQGGSLLHRQEHLDQYVETYHRQGCQIAIHANGDRAIESALRALERACTRHPGRDLRHMIIHCQMAGRDQLQRMKRIGVVPSFFVNHVYYWGDRHAELFLGAERAQRIDPLDTAVKAGLPFTLHSDLPITPVDPLFSMHCAVNRQTRAGVVLGPDERIRPLEALKAYTTWAARCSFDEADKGRIAKGKLADFAVISSNPLLGEPDAIKDIRVLQTVIGGTTVYRHR